MEAGAIRAVVERRCPAAAGLDVRVRAQPDLGRASGEIDTSDLGAR